MASSSAVSPTVPIPGRSARALASLDALANRLYGSRANPLYRSGAATVWLLVILLVTGLYLLLFYRVGSPYASVGRITDQAWLGRWIRGVHRFAADAAVVTAAVHAFRMFAQRRAWGRRTLPWVSGVALLLLILVCGWTGYVMVWDTFGRLLAVEGARILDLVPLFSEPLGRAFVGEQPLPGAFFFLNMFLHIALPIGMGVGLMVHVSRVARPTLFPSRVLMVWGSMLLVVVAVLFPIGMAPPADPLRLPATIPLDVFYAFWLPAARVTSPGWTAAGFAILLGGLLLVPRLTRPAVTRRPPASDVNARACTGCEQCALDCPYEAITMVQRHDGRATLLAHVDPTRCVSCGICAGSCAPMGVGPPGRTGRDQLAQARLFVERTGVAGRVVVIACARGGGGAASVDTFEGAPVFPVACAGSLHTSVIELCARAGAAGVLVLACPAEDCWNREGAVWVEQRMFHEREAELQERVDRRRIALAHVSLAETVEARRALTALRARTSALATESGEDAIDLLRLCDPPVREEDVA